MTKINALCGIGPEACLALRQLEAAIDRIVQDSRQKEFQIMESRMTRRSHSASALHTTSGLPPQDRISDV
jgi:hypothetical protein